MIFFIDHLRTQTSCHKNLSLVCCGGRHILPVIKFIPSDLFDDGQRLFGGFPGGASGQEPACQMQET